MQTRSDEVVSRRAGLLLLVAVLALAATLFTRRLTDTTLSYPDADRILMDGVMIRDFLCDLPLSHPVQYVAEYYARYPALSIGYRPFLFQTVEGVFNLVLGTNMWSSRLALLLFGLLGVFFWFRLVERVFDRTTAFWSAALLVTTPFVAQWGWYPMLELPVLAMTLVTLWCWQRFTESEQPRWAYATAVAWGLAVWTKQHAAFLPLCFVFHLSATRRLLGVIRRRSTWIAAAVALVIIAPVVAMTIVLGDLNLGQSIGADPRGVTIPKWHPDNLGRYIGMLATDQLTLPVLLLSAAGIAVATVKRDRRLVLFGSLIVSTYIAFTALNDPKMARYTIFWIPAFTAFAVAPGLWPARGFEERWRAARFVKPLALAGIVIFQAASAWTMVPDTASGYDEAARTVLSRKRGPIVFVDAHNNGYLTYFLRTLDPERSMVVLRGDKMLTSSAMNERLWLKVHARNQEDIKALFDKYGVSSIVVEERDYMRLPIHTALREYLAGPEFRRVAEIPIRGNRRKLVDQSLRVFEYLHARPPTADRVVLEVPIIGKTIDVPLKK